MIQFFLGDTPLLTLMVLTGLNGSAINLTGATLELHLPNADGSELVINNTAFPDSIALTDTTGQFTCDLSLVTSSLLPLLAVGRKLFIGLKVTFSGGRVQQFKAPILTVLNPSTQPEDEC